MAKFNWHKAFDKFLQKKILVIGDVMVDNYLWGNVTRISPEAPVPIVSVINKESRLGGAANVALNIQAMGAEPILCSVVGKDIPGDLFISLLKKNNLPAIGIHASNKRSTTVKTRVIAHHQQLVRVDEEIEQELDEENTLQIFKRIESLVKNEGINAIIFEDYDKGIITPLLIGKTIALAKKSGIPVAVDPKKKNFNAYRGATLFKPNFKELKEGTKSDISPGGIAEVKKIIKNLKSSNDFEMVLLTLSDKGMLIFSEKVQKVIPAHVRQIADVSGAGDTVISIAALCLATGVPTDKMAALSNLAGGLVCEQVGVVPVEREKLLAEAVKIGI